MSSFFWSISNFLQSVVDYGGNFLIRVNTFLFVSIFPLYINPSSFSLISEYAKIILFGVVLMQQMQNASKRPVIKKMFQLISKTGALSKTVKAYLGSSDIHYNCHF